LAARPQSEFWPPEWLRENMMLLRIDKKTGKIASSGTKDAVNIWFKKGTQPDDVAPEKGSVGVQDFIMGAP
ncbi:MAG TPA: hypothetical protein VEU33_03445, partial [Archangium sp.]|nr:hypothetical protein [Archangium sp.]